MKEAKPCWSRQANSLALWVILWFSNALLSGCSASQSTTATEPKGTHHLLTIYGYNYTNQSIEQFFVDGQGGSDIDVSTQEAGGGKGTCCIGWTSGTPLPQTVTVRWANAYCRMTVTNSSGESRRVRVPLFKEQEAQLQGPIPPNPGYFEVHIYPDQHVEVAITQTWSPPRLKLDPSRKVREFPPCPEGTK